MDSKATQATPKRSKSRTARFKDTLLVSITAANEQEANNQEQSAWSPLTPPASTPPATAKSLFTRFPTRFASSENNDPRSPRSASASSHPRPSTESMLKNVFGRMLRQPRSPTLPTISRPMPIGEYGTPNYTDLPSFGPLASEKPRRDSARYDMTVARKKKRRNKYIIIALSVITIIVIVIILVVRLVKPDKDKDKDANVTAGLTASSPPSPSPSPTPPLSTPDLLTPEQSKCITDFMASAPSAPLDYPVSCLKTLQTVSAEITTADPATSVVLVSAKQFSALRLLFDKCSAAAQQGLTAGGWFKDTKLCAWTGVQCDGGGPVSRLTFTNPNVPDSISAEGIIALDGLVSFVVTGTGSLPSGSLPGVPPSLRDLELNNTALGPLDSSLFAESGGLSKLETLVLVRNMNMGHSISDGIPGLSLKNLTIQSQGVTSLPSNFLNSTMARSLTFLDLSNNALTNTVPDTSSLSTLVYLNLASNNFTTITQTTRFPQTLQCVSFLDNQNLAGLLPTALCSSSTLRVCDFSKTLFSQLGQHPSCGVCKIG